MLVPGPDEPRAVIEERWLRLTRIVLPSLAGERAWPVSQDHCFQRILLDAACAGRWYDHIAGRPAYRSASDAQLAAAVGLAEQLVADDLDLVTLNQQSLRWRGKS